MAMYGFNFNGTAIPTNIKRKFAQRVTVTPGVRGYLQGVAETMRKRDLMLVQADNGHRKLHVETRGSLFGIYTY